MSTPASALPGPMASKLAAARAAAEAASNVTPNVTSTSITNTSTGTVVAPLTPTPTPTVVSTTPTPTPTVTQTGTESNVNTNADGERITLSREEYNALRASSEARAAAEGRAESARLAMEEANHRLTELSAASKGTSQSPTTQPSSTQAVALKVDTSNISFSAEEEESFAESRPYIEKVVRLILGQELNKYLPEIDSRLDAVRQAADGAVSRVAQTNQRTFLQQVQSKVPNLGEVIKHKHWADFTDSIEPYSGMTYALLLAKNVQEEKLEQVANIYNKFTEMYILAPDKNPNAAFAGANPTGSAVQTPQDMGTQQKLKYSDRKKASIDYRHGRITWEQLQEVNSRFDAADKLGNVDYNA